MKNNSIYEYKATAKIKDVDIKSGIVTGYLSTFNILDKVGDIIEKGAFKKTLEERKSEILMLKNHNWDYVAGKFDVLREDNVGLYFERNLLKGIEINGKTETTQTAKDLLILYAEGVITEHSIGYRTINAVDEVHDGEYVSILKELKLYEGSALTVEAANPFTPFTGFKSCSTTEGMLDNILKQFDLIQKSLRVKTLSEESIFILNMKFLQLQQLFSDIKPQIKTTLDKKEPAALAKKENTKKQILLNLINNY